QIPAPPSFLPLSPVLPHRPPPPSHYSPLPPHATMYVYPSPSPQPPHATYSHSSPPSPHPSSPPPLHSPPSLHQQQQHHPRSPNPPLVYFPRLLLLVAVAAVISDLSLDPEVAVLACGSCRAL
ncbi:unnamed protein product, partial [Closterium sp. NIES-54]